MLGLPLCLLAFLTCGNGLGEPACSLTSVASTDCQTDSDATSLLQVKLSPALEAYKWSLWDAKAAAISSPAILSKVAEQGAHGPTQSGGHWQMKGRYSQFGQDEWVLQLFNLFPGSSGAHAAPRFFLDIGAHDGSVCSNTKALESHGWKGICVEPFPIAHTFNNRTCVLVEQLLSQNSGEQKDVVQCGQLSGIVGDGIRVGEHIDAISDCPHRSLTTTSIGNVLADHNSPITIDFASLDVEGMEIPILESFPFSKYCVRSWTIEHQFVEQKKAVIKKLLLDQGCFEAGELEVDFMFTCPCH